MRLTDWALAPLDSPPPIPLNTDVVSWSNDGYRVGAIPPEAIADDLATLGLTYSPGRGHGYKLRGERVDSYAVGDLIADVFAEAAASLRYFLGTDETMLAIAADEAERDRIPFRDSHEFRDARALITQRIQAAESTLPFSRTDLEIAASSLARTGRDIRGILVVRTEAIRRFRAVIPAPRARRTARAALEADVAAFLASVPGGAIPRGDLHADAIAAGVEIGSQTLYRAADALGWPLVKRRGVYCYRVPETRRP